MKGRKCLHVCKCVCVWLSSSWISLLHGRYELKEYFQMWISRSRIFQRSRREWVAMITSYFVIPLSPSILQLSSSLISRSSFIYLIASFFFLFAILFIFPFILIIIITSSPQRMRLLWMSMILLSRLSLFIITIILIFSLFFNILIFFIFFFCFFIFIFKANFSNVSLSILINSHLRLISWFHFQISFLLFVKLWFELLSKTIINLANFSLQIKKECYI